MSENRARRVAGQIKKEVSQIINLEIKDPRVTSLVSVTGVILTRDLQYATVYVSIYGSEEEKRDTYETLLRASGFIRGEIGRRIRLRRTPEIAFQQDNSMEYGARIEQVLKTLDMDKDQPEK
ncbi:MAG: 30S ribosome-binding factor RbfA [Dethiobacter sp.]|jgi:ribosome-binding factor A|nr:30S ribosome-binding factor RbfA [Dethiobacter sp.]MBS3943284.1 30S ribosome-binding factor RbfA [Dethiobacter sp.]